VTALETDALEARELRLFDAAVAKGLVASKAHSEKQNGRYVIADRRVLADYYDVVLTGILQRDRPVLVAQGPQTGNHLARWIESLRGVKVPTDSFASSLPSR